MDHLSTASNNVAPADETGSRRSRPALTHLLLICQLLLLLKVVQVFQIESQRFLLSLMCLATGGFVIYHRLPASFRPPFFLLLSLIGFPLVLGGRDGAIVLAVGMLLIGIGHFPLARIWQCLLLVGCGAVLAYLRIAYRLPFWPILGSIFMFRLAIYVRETKNVPTSVPWSLRLSYFFLLPNVCFPFFPLVDYKTFVGTYRSEDALECAQSGIAWIVRGIVHLLLYRLVKYHVLPPPDDLLNISDTVLFLGANYGLYLHVSGTFHVITGMLRLFGFQLPPTHDWYFLAHSFTDIWRRINIYWKDFLSQHIFLPVFFRWRAAGDRFGIVATVILVFVCTWLLHSYQVFWLLGEFPLRPFEAGLWFIAGIVVSINALVDYRAAQHPSPPSSWNLATSLRRSVQIVAVFFCVCIFWGSWSLPEILPAILTRARLHEDFARGWSHVAVGTLVAVLLLTAGQFLREWLKRRNWRPGVIFEHSPIPATAIATSLLIISQPFVHQRLDSDSARVVASLSVDVPTTLDLVRTVPGYYEELAAANRQVDALFAKEKPQSRPGELLYGDITRPRNDLLELELIPRWKGTLAGAPLSINRWGMRDGPVSRDKSENTQRIAVVGSSVVMGYGVRDEEVFTELIEKDLNANLGQRGRRFEVLNFGVGRYYALHIAVALRTVVFDFEPDIVFYVAHQGELFGPPRHLAKCRFERHPMPYPCLDELMRRAGITDETSWGSIQSTLQTRMREITLCIYQGIVADCRQRGIRPVWIYLPMPGIADVPANTSEMLKLAQEAGFEVVDLSHWADGRKPEDVKLSAVDHHANAVGHRLIADHLLEAFKNYPVVSE